MQAIKTAVIYFTLILFSPITNSETLVVLGDSLSAAYKLAEDEGWVAFLEQQLQKDELNIKIVNASISGATTVAGINTLPLILEREKPTMIIIALGANDGLQGKPVNYIKRNLERLVLMAQQNNSRVMLIGVRLPPNFGKRYTDPFFSQYTELAEKYKLAYIPFILEGVAGNSELMQADGLHPSAAGQVKVFKHLWPEIKKFIMVGQ